MKLVILGVIGVIALLWLEDQLLDWFPPDEDEKQ